MTHVLDELELYALGALGASDRERVAGHLAACAPCRSASEELGGVVDALAVAVADREPPAALRERILASARGAGGAVRLHRAGRVGPWLAAGALAAATVVLAVLNVATSRELATAQDQLAATREVSQCVAEGGRTWPMRGVGQWVGAGGMLVTRGTAPGCAVFHDLAAVPPGHTYTIWLIDQDGRWVRGSSFTPRGRVQMVGVGVPLDGFEQCAITLETRTEGKHEGPIVMQSRIYQATPPPPAN